MKYKPFRIVSFCEFYLHNLSKLEALGPKERTYFWNQRSWHPVIRFTWNDMTESDGAGKVTYPDGTTRSYVPISVNP